MGQYFSNEKIKSKIKQFSTIIDGKPFSFWTDHGVFCKSYVDFGTRLLLETIAHDPLQGKALDIGCGYGVIGIFLAKNFNIHVTMVDVNQRALHLAQKNAKENNVSVEIKESDCYQQINDCYDIIVTNPPIRAGKKIVYEILEKAKDHLKENGILYFVIRKDQGAKSVISDLEKQYKVVVREREKGFYVIQCNLPLTS